LNELALFVGCRLVVHATQGSPRAIKRGAALNDIGIESLLCEFPATEGPDKETSTVLDWFGFDFVGTLQRQLGECHGSISTLGIGVTN
jgi:hypothetical protein